MKKLIKLFFVLAVITFATNTFASELGLKAANLNLSAPAAKSKKSSSGGGIEKGDIQIDANFIAGTNWPLVFRGPGGYGGGYYGFGGFSYYGFGGLGLLVNIDYAVHPYASVGGYFGLVGFPSAGHRGSLGVGFGVRGVFHIYQLIADKTSTKVDPGKLDFYTTIHLGGNIYAGTASSVDGSGFQGGGPSFGWGLGVRYYFNDRIGINTQVGWLEMSVFKVGLAVKL